jgi:hypothetical protein
VGFRLKFYSAVALQVCSGMQTVYSAAERQECSGMRTESF